MGAMLSKSLERAHAGSRWPFGDLKNLTDIRGFLFWWVVRDDGVIHLADNSAVIGTRAADYLPQAWSAPHDPKILLDRRQDLILYRTPLSLGRKTWSFWLGFSLGEIAEFKKQIFLRALLLALLTLVILGIGIFLIIRRFLQPVRDLAVGAAVIGGGDLSYQIPQRSADELGQLVEVFNRMARSLQEKTQALREGEQFLTNVFASIQDGISILDRDYTIVRVNQAMERAYAQAMPLVGQKCYEAYHGRSEPCEICPARSTMETGLAARDMVIEKGAEGEIIRYVDLYTFPLMDPASGQMTGVVEYVRDITEQRRAQEALRKSEEKYGLLVQQIPAVAFQGYGDWSVDFFDRKIESLSGYSKEEFDSRKIKWCDLILPEDLPQARESLINALKADKSYLREYRIRRKDGGIRWIQAMGQIFCDDAGKIAHTSGIFFDVTDRKKTEEVLWDHYNFLQTMIDTIPSPIFYKDVNGVYLGCNKALSDFLDLPKEEIVGKTVYDVYPQDLADKYFEMDAALFRQGGVQIYDFSMGHADGTRHDVNFHKAAYSTIDGALAGLVGVMIDITERKKAEVERLRFSKLEALATLAGGIAHDFNNILTAIMGNISLAMLNTQKEEYNRKRLGEAEKACLQAQMLAQQLLTFAKGGAPIKELVSVNKLVSETASFTCRGSQVRCQFSFPDNLWAAEVDPGQTSQVFQNLVINAIQAMPTGGVIKVQGENLVVEAESDLPLGPGRYVKISIQDQGVGMPRNYLPRIFDPYFTTKQTGSGLGLATAYSIVKNHQGHISVESELGVGTTFHIYLPAAHRKFAAPKEIERGVLTGHGKILVMDDDRMVRELLDRMLGHLGYEAKLAGDGDEALQMYNGAQKSGKPFDAVILDLTIPGGMGGKETIEKLLKIDPRAKAIVSSGYSDDPIMAGFAKYGFSAVIAKPYRISELSKVLHKVLAKDRKGDVHDQTEAEP